MRGAWSGRIYSIAYILGRTRISRAAESVRPLKAKDAPRRAAFESPPSPDGAVGAVEFIRPIRPALFSFERIGVHRKMDDRSRASVASESPG